MKPRAILCTAALVVIALLVSGNLYAACPLPPPANGTINVTITSDNAYRFGFGTAAGITQLFSEVNNCTAADIFSAATGPECYNVPASLDAYIYIVAWSDEAKYQGLIAEFTDAYGTTVLTQPLPQGSPQWEVYATGRDRDPCPPFGEAVDLVTLNAHIADASAGQGPAFPASSETWVNQYSAGNTGRLDFDPYVNDISSPPPTNDFPPSAVYYLGPAQWMWYNPYPNPPNPCTPPNPACIEDPFVEGVHTDFPWNEMMEYYIFRIGPLYQLLEKNHYKTWKLERPLNAGALETFVLDEYMSDWVVLDTIDFLSNPARKDTFNIVGDTTAHLTWYRAHGRDTLLPVFYENQFESTFVCIDSVKYLLVPTQKDPHGPYHDLDHYKAYRIRDQKTLIRQVEVQDQFDAMPEIIDSLVPRYFLTPAQKMDELRLDTLTHYVAYELFPKDVISLVRVTHDQFGAYDLPFGRSELLLVPTRRLPEEDCFSTGDVNDDGLSPSIADYLALYRFVYFMGPPPKPLYEGDLNGDGFIDHVDLGVYNCYFDYGMSCFPQFPVPVPCCTDTVRGCCETSGSRYVRSPSYCAMIGGTYLGDGEPCDCYPAPKNMRLWLPFDEGTPGPSENVVATEDGIQYGSLVTVAGRVGGALHFDGATSYVEVSSYASQDVGTKDFSIDAWVRRDQNSTGVRTLVDKRVSLGGGMYRGYSFYLYDGRLGCQIADGQWTGWNTLPGEVVLTGDWYHVAVTVDRNSPTGGQFYVDGSPFGSPFNPTLRQGSLTNTGPFRVGSVSFALQTVFLGGIDEVEVYDRQLTAAEIQGIYDAQSTSVGKCRCYCPFQGDFDEDGFLTALDLSAMIDILFAGQPDIQDPGCPSPRADFDCDGFSTALDLSALIDHLFAGGAGPCDPCAQ